jgi:nucleoside-diphosphate-sugar epimerase
MRFLVTGGSGFYGINQIRLLLARGQEVVSFDRLPFDYPEKDRVRAVVGDIRDAAAIRAACEGCDVVIHAAAALPLYAEEEIRATDIDGTRNVLEAALAAGAKRFIHISSTAVYGIPDHHPLREDDRLEGVGPYGIAKIEAERLCEEYRAKGMTVSVIRPKSFVGPERLGVFAILYDWAADGRNFPMIGSGKNRYQLLDVEDLCEAVWICATKEDASAVNDVFNIGAKEFKTMGEDYQAVLDRAGHGKRVVGLPAAPVIWALRVLEFFRLSPIYKWVYETAAKDSFVSIEKAERVLGWKPRYSNAQALVRNYEWYLAHRGEFAKASGVTHRVPWKQGAIGLLKRFF